MTRTADSVARLVLYVLSVVAGLAAIVAWARYGSVLWGAHLATTAAVAMICAFLSLEKLRVFFLEE